ncbi:MAG: hypothetical protein WD851_11075 [Pirellulales bacterium]
MSKFVFFVVISVPLNALGEWTPPSNPDPEKILNEARNDARAGRLEEALSKHLWFHEHALDYVPSLYGVRLTTALTDWHDLGEAYPPAMEKLEETRDASRRKVIEGTEELRLSFREVRSINKLLDHEAQTAALFEELDKNKSDVAREVYDIAQPALVKAEKYALCGKYLVPNEAYERTVTLLELNREQAEELKSPLDRRDRLDYAERTFIEDAATLVGLLVLNEQKPKAVEIADDARGKSKHLESNAILDAALEGRLPTCRSR